MYSFLRKIYIYFRNKFIVYESHARVWRRAKKKLKNPEVFYAHYSNRNAAPVEFELQFVEGFRLKLTYPDLSAVAETCILEDYAPKPQFAMRPDLTVLDIGANVGDYTVWAAWSGARVYAFEPEPRNIDRLKANVQLNGLDRRVVVVPEALFSHSGQIQLSFSNQSAGGHTVGGGAGTLVSCITLEDFLAREHIDMVDILKIDVEGAEYEIFGQISPQVFAKVKGIVGEYHMSLADEPNFKTLHRLLSPHYAHVASYYPFYFYAYND